MCLSLSFSATLPGWFCIQQYPNAGSTAGAIRSMLLSNCNLHAWWSGEMWCGRAIPRLWKMSLNQSFSPCRSFWMRMVNVGNLCNMLFSVFVRDRTVGMMQLTVMVYSPWVRSVASANDSKMDIRSRSCWNSLVVSRRLSCFDCCSTLPNLMLSSSVIALTCLNVLFQRVSFTIGIALPVPSSASNALLNSGLWCTRLACLQHLASAVLTTAVDASRSRITNWRSAWSVTCKLANCSMWHQRQRTPRLPTSRDQRCHLGDCCHQYQTRRTWLIPCCLHYQSPEHTFVWSWFSVMTPSRASAIFWPMCEPWNDWSASKWDTGWPIWKACTVTPRNACARLSVQMSVVKATCSQNSRTPCSFCCPVFWSAGNMVFDTVCRHGTTNFGSRSLRNKILDGQQWKQVIHIQWSDL